MIPDDIYSYKYRYINSFFPTYENMLNAENNYLNSKTKSQKEKKDFALKIKQCFEFSWKIMKNYLKDKGEKVLLPRQIILAMKDNIDSRNWLSLLDNIVNYIQTKEDKYIDLIVSNYFLTYKKLFENLVDFFESLNNFEIKDFQKEEFPHKNRCVLDSFSLYLFFDYFRHRPKIHRVYLYGSRAIGKCRESSDIDLIIDGEYSEKEFNIYEKEMQTIKHPYLLDLTNLKESEYINKDFMDRALQNSILLYDRSDFV